MLKVLNRVPILKSYSKVNALGGIGVGLFLLNGIVQRIFNINGQINSQVHYSSKVTGNKLVFHKDRNTLLSLAVSGNVYIQALNGVYLGENVLFAPGVKIISANHNKEDRRASDYSLPITINDNVWIGANAIILPGVTIASNSIIGAGAVVTKSFLEDGSIIVGNPAKKINK